MNYSLNKPEQKGERKTPMREVLKKFAPLLKGEQNNLVISFIAILVNSGLNLLAPILIGHAIDTYFVQGDFTGVLTYGMLLLVIYLLASVASFVQTRVMGAVSQRMLFNLRNTIFHKLQQLPVAFFNQNKAGDLISRINNDTDKLNQFFSQSLMQFVGSLFMMAGTGIAVVVINPRLGVAALVPAAGLLILTRLASAWIKRSNAKSLKVLGAMSANIQESINNFKVVIAFHRRDYFRARFSEVNDQNFNASVTAGVANTTFTPVYGLAANMAVLIVITYGIHLIGVDLLTIGVLISFLTYVNRFYDPLRHLAALWTSFQSALAGWDRISEILSLESDMVPLAAAEAVPGAPLLRLTDVGFSYPNGKDVLRNVNLTLEQGKTYALVGPTGGGKTTTASLMARLYDPTTGTVTFQGKDIRSVEASERTAKIGFILQEPFLFTGTVRDNILYGNEAYHGYSEEQLSALLAKEGLDGLLARFDEGLATRISANGEDMSLGQRQLIAFIRAVLRKPELLILDEATANIDTVTEQLLEEVLAKLPTTTTRVIIAHRLNTIENADEIFFVNGGEVTQAGSFEHAVDLLLNHTRES